MKKPCNLSIDGLLESYLKEGWNKLISKYARAQESSKPNDDKYKITQHMLEILGKIRNFYIEYLFSCIKKNKYTYYINPGSSNLTSDVDLIIIGQDAPQVVFQMFLKYLKNNQRVSAISLDINFYCVGVFANRNSRKLPEKIVLDKKTFVLQPLTKEQNNSCYSFALLKLIKSKINTHSLHNLQSIIDITKKLDKTLQTIYQQEKKTNKYIKNRSAKVQDYIIKYSLYYKYSKKLYDILYGSKNTNNLFYYIGISNYFSIEGYWAQPTVNVVVIEMQRKIPIKLKKSNYLCSVIENLGDLNTHYHHYKHLNIKSRLLKISKYIYRIYYALSKIYQSKYRDKQTKQFKKHIVNKRGTANLSTINFNYLTKGKLKNFITLFNTEILDEINTIFAFLNQTNHKTRKRGHLKKRKTKKRYKN